MKKTTLTLTAIFLFLVFLFFTSCCSSDLSQTDPSIQKTDEVIQANDTEECIIVFFDPESNSSQTVQVKKGETYVFPNNAPSKVPGHEFSGFLSVQTGQKYKLGEYAIATKSETFMCCYEKQSLTLSFAQTGIESIQAVYGSVWHFRARCSRIEY